MYYASSLVAATVSLEPFHDYGAYLSRGLSGSMGPEHSSNQRHRSRCQRLGCSGAGVKATQTATGAVRTTTSAADGSFVLPNLVVGPYLLEGTKEGFSKYVQSGIVLQVASNPTIDVALKVGTVTEQVTVQADAALVETHDSGVGTVVDNQRVVEMPLNGRNVTGTRLPGGTSDNSPGWEFGRRVILGTKLSHSCHIRRWRDRQWELLSAGWGLL